ncbi:MAG TPA: pyridoxal-phosphate dependent enzyme, partial [Trueperaceae bacterium]|nr:pyridoxal-phosphate dependent enzyme [Trueperaceae bacterium]
LDQFANADNYLAHERTTGPEIWRDTGGDVSHFVSAMGTTGTIMGVSRFLKAQNPAVQVVGTQPAPGSQIPGIRRWSPEFVPAIYQPERVDRLIEVSSAAAVSATRRLATEEGILAGMSGGGALAAALSVVDELTTRGETGTVVFIVPDRGERYLSGDLFG